MTTPQSRYPDLPLQAVEADLDVSTLGDATLVTSAADGTAYLLRNGRRQQIIDPVSVLAAGIDPRERNVKKVTLSAEQLDRIPSDAVLQLGGTRQFDSGFQHLGANHWMRTWGSLDLATGQIAGQTRTATFTWFGGFHGATYVIFRDANDAPVYQTTSLHRFGVDGTWIGTSDRTDVWWESMLAGDTAHITAHTIFLVWAPDNFQYILDQWAQSGQKVASLVGSVGAVAAVIAG
jgi:hypothetical protein